MTTKYTSEQIRKRQEEATAHRGFLDWAERYISNNPGLTAKEIAKACLDLGIVVSRAQDPVASLANTLHSYYMTRNVVRCEESPPYTFYPGTA